MRLLNFWQTPSIGIEFIINLIIFHFHEFYSSYSSFLCFVPPPLSHTILFELVLDNILSTLEYYVSIFDEFKCNPPPHQSQTFTNQNRIINPTWPVIVTRTTWLWPKDLTLITPTATVCLMSRTAKRPRGGNSWKDSTHNGLVGTKLMMAASPDLMALGFSSVVLPEQTQKQAKIFVSL